MPKIVNKEYCPYVTYFRRGKDVADAVFCLTEDPDLCDRCGWNPKEIDRRNRAIKRGIGVEPVNVVVDATEISKIAKDNGDHIMVTYPNRKALVLSRITYYE